MDEKMQEWNDVSCLYRLFGRLCVRRMNDHLAFFAHTHAFRADSGHVLQGQMHDAALARRHGIQPERLARSLHAFRSNARGHSQFFKTESAVAAGVDVNFFMIGRFQSQRPESEVLEGLQNFRAAFQENRFVLAVEIGKHFGVAFRACSVSRNGPHTHL